MSSDLDQTSLLCHSFYKLIEPRQSPEGLKARIVWEDIKGNNLFTSDPFFAKDEVRPLLPAYDIPITEDRVKHVPETNVLLNGKKIKGPALRTEVMKVFSGNTAMRRILAVVNKNLKE